jgi:hypothetical protein
VGAVWATRKRYLLAILQESWMEGIFVFPTTGDIVVRLPTLLAQEEYTFEKERVQCVEVRSKWTWLSCGQELYLIIQHNAGEYAVASSRLAGGARQVAAHINQLRERRSQRV